MRLEDMGVYAGPPVEPTKCPECGESLRCKFLGTAEERSTVTCGCGSRTRNEVERALLGRGGDD